MRCDIKKYLIPVVIVALQSACPADVFVTAPTVNYNAQTGTALPFLPAVLYLPPVTLRYQQVYNASLFTNVDRSFIYLTVLGFREDSSHVLPWFITNLQINVSTTQSAADALSLTFRDNVGPDDTVVLGPGIYEFGAGVNQIPLDRPFRYDPRLGNLLLDVRIRNGNNAFGGYPGVTEAAFNSSTDEVSRVWAPDVIATDATESDTIGFGTSLQFSPVPSLTNYVYTCACNPPTNYMIIDWPIEPFVFVLQQSDRLGNAASWRTVTNTLGDRTGSSFRRYYFPAASGGPFGYFRLIWPGGP